MSGNSFDQDVGNERGEGIVEELGEVLDIDEILEEQNRKLDELVELFSKEVTQRTTVQVNGETVTIEQQGGQVFKHGTENLVNSPIDEEFVVPAEAKTLVIHVDDAEQPFDVSVKFLDPSRSTITERDSSDASIYSGDSNTDVYISDDIASPFIRVVVEDDGAGDTNEVDYVILAS